MTGAALAIPAAAAGTFAAYQSYFSTDVTCQKLRNDIVGIMERHVDPDTKRSLLKKDVTEFDKLCGEGDPDARAIFQAAMSEHPAQATHAAAAPAPLATGASSQFQRLCHLGYFVAASRYSFIRQDDAAGLVRAAGRRQRSEQAAEPPAVRRLRARTLDSRRQRPIVGRSRARLVLVSARLSTRLLG
jgi:hypothetical protein